MFGKLTDAVLYNVRKSDNVILKFYRNIYQISIFLYYAFADLKKLSHHLYCGCVSNIRSCDLKHCIMGIIAVTVSQ